MSGMKMGGIEIHNTCTDKIKNGEYRARHLGLLKF